MKTTLVLIIVLLSISSFAQSSYMDKCNNQHSSGQSTGSSFVKESPACHPDTLYSWQPISRINWEVFTKTPLAFGKSDYLYAWRTPLGTFGYGDVQIRMKLRADVEFIEIDETMRFCESLTRTYSKKAVFVSIFNVGYGYVTDYLLCSGDPIESWSAHASGAFDEAERELTYLETHYKNLIQTYDSYLMPFGRKRIAARYPGLYFIPIDHGIRSWSAFNLKKKTNSLKVLLNNQMGRVYGESTNDHFSTKVNLYY